MIFVTLFVNFYVKLKTEKTKYFLRVTLNHLANMSKYHLSGLHVESACADGGIELSYWYRVYEYTRAKYNSINQIDSGKQGIVGLGNLGMNRDWVFFVDKNGTTKWQRMSSTGNSEPIEITDLKISERDSVVVLGNKYYPQTGRSHIAIFSFDQKGTYQ
ncbi:hypothetical protein, partial [Thermococcus sp.]